jgi:formylglycine-generating enzyme required for sulfatase activity
MNKKFLLLFSAISLFITITYAQQYPEIIKVKGGTYRIGDEIGIGEPDEQPVHSVTVKTFGIAKTETTVLQWKTYCNATGQQMPKVPKRGWIDDYPIVYVSWEDAVAQKSANELGLYEMTGNVWEWCLDRYVFVAYAQTNSKNIKTTPSTRIVRGGSLTTTAKACRIADRGSCEPTYRDPFAGFRVAVSL